MLVPCKGHASRPMPMGWVEPGRGSKRVLMMDEMDEEMKWDQWCQRNQQNQLKAKHVMQTLRGCENTLSDVTFEPLMQSTSL